MKYTMNQVYKLGNKVLDSQEIVLDLLESNIRQAIKKTFSSAEVKKYYALRVQLMDIIQDVDDLDPKYMLSNNGNSEYKVITRLLNEMGDNNISLDLENIDSMDMKNISDSLAKIVYKLYHHSIIK